MSRYARYASRTSESIRVLGLIACVESTASESPIRVISESLSESFPSPLSDSFLSPLSESFPSPCPSVSESLSESLLSPCQSHSRVPVSSHFAEPESLSETFRFPSALSRQSESALPAHISNRVIVPSESFLAPPPSILFTHFFVWAQSESFVSIRVIFLLGPIVAASFPYPSRFSPPTAASRYVTWTAHLSESLRYGDERLTSNI